MDEGQQLREDGKGYRPVPRLITDEPPIAVPEMLLRETEDRLAQIENRPPD